MSDMVVSVQGFTMKMGAFNQKYRNAFKKANQNIHVVAQRFLGRWARNVMIAARYLAPSSGETGNMNITARGSSLANSIIVVKNDDLTSTIKHASVGVDSSLWNSNYPKKFFEKYHHYPPWGVKSKNMALFIHEYWDKFTANKPKARARAKEKRHEFLLSDSVIMGNFKGDSHVGEKFLYRAAIGVSSRRGLAVIASAEMKAAFRTYGTEFKIGKYKNFLAAPKESKPYEYTNKPEQGELLDY